MKFNYIDGIDNRENFAKLIDQHAYKTGVEIGVDQGRFSAYLLANSKLEKLWSVDPWKKFPERKAESEIALKPFGNRSSIIENFSTEAARLFQSDSIDFVYIDGDHRYKAMCNDLEIWWKIVSHGGCLAGHDYVVRRLVQVIPAVDQFVQKNGLQLYLTREDGPTIEDQLKSWFIFKPEG
jgi:predicted O-methyltransferase YrrM